MGDVTDDPKSTTFQHVSVTPARSRRLTGYFLSKRLVKREQAYLFGEGVPQSDEKAFELHSQNAAQGDPGGQVSVAWPYQAGRGCKHSDERAFELFRQSAAQGNDLAQHNLAVSATCLLCSAWRILNDT